MQTNCNFSIKLVESHEKFLGSMKKKEVRNMPSFLEDLTTAGLFFIPKLSAVLIKLNVAFSL